MSGVTFVPIGDIHVPEDRLRPVKPEYAALFARSLAEGEDLPPVMVRRTPNGAKKLTLVAGAHRLEAYRQAGRTHIPAMIRKLNAEQAREAEIQENLFRNELSALDRIVAVAEYRRLFDAQFEKSVAVENAIVSDTEYFGQVGHLVPDDLNLLGLNDASQEGSFYARATERLGISARACRRATGIMKRLRPELLRALYNSTYEDNQGAIERVSKLVPEAQEALARAIEIGKGDAAAAEAALTARRPVLAAWEKRRATVYSNFAALAGDQRRMTLVELLRDWPEEAEAAIQEWRQF